MATTQDYLKNAKWVVRCVGWFNTLDTDKNGYVSRENYLAKVDNLAKARPGNPDAIAKLRKVTNEFTEELGLTEGVKVAEQKYLEITARMVVDEVARMKKGEMTSFEKYNNALYDVVDKNRDGRLTFEEFKVVSKSLGFDESTPKATFDLLDKNKDGTIDRKEFIGAHIKFWCTLDDPNTKGMLGDQFE